MTGWLYENAGRAEAVLVVAALLAACALAATTITESHPRHWEPGEGLFSG